MAAPTLSIHRLNLSSFFLTDGAVRIASKPWFSESTDRCKSPTVSWLLGWKEWWLFMVLLRCRAQSPATEHRITTAGSFWTASVALTYYWFDLNPCSGASSLKHLWMSCVTSWQAVLWWTPPISEKFCEGLHPTLVRYHYRVMLQLVIPMSDCGDIASSMRWYTGVHLI